MKLNLALPNTQSKFRLLFSNIGNREPTEFNLLMVFHKSKKGGFNQPVSVEDCKKALRRKNATYKLREASDGSLD